MTAYCILGWNWKWLHYNGAQRLWGGKCTLSSEQVLPHKFISNKDQTEFLLHLRDII